MSHLFSRPQPREEFVYPRIQMFLALPLWDSSGVLPWLNETEVYVWKFKSRLLLRPPEIADMVPTPAITHMSDRVMRSVYGRPFTNWLVS